jgi:hypothetical protein
MVGSLKNTGKSFFGLLLIVATPLVGYIVLCAAALEYIRFGLLPGVFPYLFGYLVRHHSFIFIFSNGTNVHF